MTKFFALTEIRKPEDIIPFLGKPDLHWKPGYSACELARSWVGAADGVPAPVRAVLETSQEYGGAELVEGFFERQVDLRTPGRASQTDLLVLLRVHKEFAVLAVEGKVEEPFGPLVSEWDDGSTGKRTRLAGLCAVLGLDQAAARGLRYQLLHRAVSAVFEAERYGCGRALLLVHSFSAKRSSLADFVAFSETLGCPVEVGQVSPSARDCGGVGLRLSWVADQVSPT